MQRQQREEVERFEKSNIERQDQWQERFEKSKIEWEETQKQQREENARWREQEEEILQQRTLAVRLICQKSRNSNVFIHLLQLEKERQEYEDEKIRGLKFIENNKNPIKLSVGGVIFHTSVSNLTKFPSMISTMLSGRFEIEKDETGAVFIDRDGMS